MKQRFLLILLALVGMMSGAHAQEAYSVKLIEDGYYGDSKSIAITALRPGETVPEDIYQSIKENECELYPGTVVTLTIGVDEGWYVSKVMAITSISTEQMQAPRRTNETNLLTQVPVTKGEGGTWTFTMPEANVEIYIKYLNTPPYFVDAENTKLVVPENTVRAKAGTIKAIDDQGDAFTYEILGGTGEDLFEINLTTGVVSLRNGVEPFDFEEWKDAGGVGYTLVIGVCDTRAYNFDDVFGTQATFTVNISDKNEKPYFTNETDVIYIAEGAATSTDVVTYADIDKYATGDFVNNELTIISDESNLFEISADGHIKTKEGVVLDYETQKDQVFTIEVRVRDANKDTDGNYIYPDLYEDKTFKVKVSDVNEAPTFKAEAYNYELLATERTEQVLGTVETTDPDTYATNFSTITYSLEGDDAANFKIDATTGKISLTNGAAFNYADKSVYSFYAVANDTKNKVTVPVTVTLKRKQLTITADNKSKTFGATDPELTYQVEGLVGNDKLTVELSREKGEELGSYAIDAVITASSNYDVQFTKGAFTITACTDAIVVTITGNTLKAEFDGKTQTVSGYTVACNNELYDINKYVSFSGDSIVSGTDVKTYDMGLTEAQFANNFAGFTNVTFKVTDGTLTITPKAVTITAQSKAFTYTGETQSWPQYDVEGLVGNDAIKAVVIGSITLPGESPVVNKVESYEFTKGTAGNYSVTTKNGELTMTAADVAITITAASQQWTYDGTAHSNSGVTITSGSLLDGDALVAEATGSVTNVADTETGNNPVAEGYKVMHGETDVTANYAITAVAGTLTIAPKAVTITAQSHAFTYTGEAQSWPQYDVEGLVGDDAITAVVTGSITYPSQGTVANKVESYEFTKGTAGNYSVTTKNGELTMTAADVAITITAASQQWTYDGTAHTNTAVTITSGELLTGDVLVATAAGSVTNVADTNTGNNPVAEGYKVMHGETDVTANYAITAVAGTLTIAPKAVTITAQSHAFTYTGETQSWPQYDVEGLVGDDAITAVVTGSITLPGESPMVNKVESYEFTKGTAGNYSVTTKNGELTMTAADVAITITAASQQWTYDGTAHSNSGVTITSGELLAGDVLVATAAGSATNVADTETGNNPVAEGYKVMHGETDVTANYAITTVAGTLTITPKAVTITAQSHAFTYTGETQSWAKYDVEGLVGNDAITAVVTGSITLPGESPVVNKVESYEFTKGTAGNYSVTTKNGELTMTAADVAITITAASQQWTYDGTAHTNTAVTITSGELLSGDVLVATAAGSVTNVADTETGNNPVAEGYKVMHGETDVTASYAITTVVGTLTITPKAVTITSQSEEFTYDGLAHTNANYDVEGLVGDDAIKAVVSESIKYVRENYVDNKIVSYEFTKGDPTNYDVKLKGGRLTMLKAKLILTGGITICKNVTNGDVTYSVDCSNVEFNGLVGSDKITISGITISSIEINEDGSETIMLGFSNVLLEGDNLDCYEFTTAEGAETVTIAKTIVVDEEGTTTETTVTQETNEAGLLVTTTTENTVGTDGSTSNTEKKEWNGEDGNQHEKMFQQSFNADGDPLSSAWKQTVSDEVGPISENGEYMWTDEEVGLLASVGVVGERNGSDNWNENVSGNVWSQNDNLLYSFESETLYGPSRELLSVEKTEQWDKQEEGLKATSELTGLINDEGNWDETLKRSVSDPLGNTLYKSVTNTTIDENDNTWMTSFEELYDPDKGEFINILLASAKDEKDLPSLKWDADEDTEFKNLSGEFADIDKMVVSNEYAANPWVRTDESLLESLGLSDAYFQADNWSNIDVKCKTEFNKEGDAIDREYSYVVNQWTDETNMAVVNEKSGNLFNVEYNEEEPLYDFDAKFDSWKFNDESIFDKAGLPTDKEENANGTWGDEDNRQIEIWGKEEDLRKISELYSPRRAPEEDENVPEGYIKIESGVDYEVLKEGPIILTIITKGGPMEIKSIKFKESSISTAIREVADSSKAKTGVWYTLDGRRLSSKPNTKGIYIVDGKKVEVK